MLEDPRGGKSFSARWAYDTPMLPFLPLCPLLGASLPLFPKSKSPQRHKKQCIVCPATKGNAEKSKWPPAPSRCPQSWGYLGVPRLPKASPRPLQHTPPCFREGPSQGSPESRAGPQHHRAVTLDLGEHLERPRGQGWVGEMLCSLCNCVAERLPRSCVTGDCGGGGAGAAAPLCDIKGATSM